MKIDERYQKVIEYFKENMPFAETELHYNSAYELLTAVILSAQCTDKRVNLITPDFFKRFPDAVSLSKAEPDEVFEYIKSCSYPSNKAKHLVGMAKTLINEFNNIVPSDIEQLQKLPGVGRKTANVVASVVFNIPAMAVDTHVFRVSKRIGLTHNAKTPLSAELQLVNKIPEHLLATAHHWLILHGRYICTARKPKCHDCGIKAYCKYFEALEHTNS
jgi:endonuclease-3